MSNKTRCPSGDSSRLSGRTPTTPVLQSALKGGLKWLWIAVFLPVFLVESRAQSRSRSVVGWGESVLGLNQMPPLPAGVTANDIDALASGELVNAVGLKSSISGYSGPRIIVSGASILTGDSAGKIFWGAGTGDFTTWDQAVVNTTSGALMPDRVSFGFLHAAVILPNGTMAFVGDRQGSYFPATPSDANLVAVATSATHALGLRANGSVVGIGGANFFGENTVPVGLSGAVGVAAGEYFSAAVLNNGQVVVWGTDANGVLQIPATATNIVSVKAGATHLVALRADGTVIAWGNAADGRTSVPTGLNRVAKIAVGRAHAVALRDDGTVAAWGYNGSGQASIPSGLINVIDIAAGGNHSLALVSREKPTLNAVVASIAGVSFNLASGYAESGQVIRLTASVAGGAPPVQYRWRKNGALVAGATNATLDITVGSSEGNAISMDVEAINTFGADSESVAVKVGSSPSDLAIQAGRVSGGGHLNIAGGTYWEPTGTFTPMGRRSDGGFLTSTLTGQTILQVKAKGNPEPDLWVYDADSMQMIFGPSSLAGASSVAQGIRYPFGKAIQSSEGVHRYVVIVGNSLGRLTNTFSVFMYPAAVPPPIVANFPNIAGLNGATLPAGQPAAVGPISVGTTGVTLAVDDNYTASAGSVYQWMRNGADIIGGTNRTLALGSFAVSNAVPYTVRVRTPLYGSSVASDSTLGQATSSSLTPILPVSVTLSRTNLASATGGTVDFDVTMTGSLTAKIYLEKEISSGVWSGNDDLLGNLTSQAAPASANWLGWASPSPGSTPPPTKEFFANLNGLGGSLNLRIGGVVTTAQKGNYRLVSVQMSQGAGALTAQVPLEGTLKFSYFTVSITETPSITAPTSTPSASASGGTWISGVANGVDMTIAAKANATVDLAAYLSIAGSPTPNVRWEKQTAQNQFAVVRPFANSSSLVLAAVPTNAGIYRVTATNSIGGNTGVTKLIALNVDRVLSVTNGAMVFPDATVDLPISLVGFGDESVLSFTLQIDSAYISTAAANVAMTLDSALAATTTLSYRTSGSVDATPAVDGAGGNRLKMQVLVSKTDPTKTFSAGTNRLGTLTLKAQDISSIGVIRSGTANPSLDAAIQILGSGTVGPDYLPLSIALTNATLTSLVAESGSVRVLADSLEGDVDGNFAVNVIDVTAIGNVLAAGAFGSFSTPVRQSRLDTAPRLASGDTRVNLADLVQVARYAAKLDAAQPAGGPSGTFALNGGIVLPKVVNQRKSLATGQVRRIRLGWADLVAGQEVWVPVLLSGYGNENALAFNVEFDPGVIEYTGLKAATGTSQMENNLAAQEGRVGVILWKAAGKAVPPGECSVAELGFRVKAAVGSAKIRFGSRPVDSLIATVDAQPVTTVEFEGGEWSIAQRRRVVGGRMVSQHMAAGRWNVELQAIDSAGVPVSAVNRSIRVQSANRLDANDTEWTPVGVAPEVTPLGTLRLPLPQSADQATRFYRIREE